MLAGAAIGFAIAIVPPILVGLRYAVPPLGRSEDLPSLDAICLELANFGLCTFVCVSWLDYLCAASELSLRSFTWNHLHIFGLAWLLIRTSGWSPLRFGERREPTIYWSGRLLWLCLR